MSAWQAGGPGLHRPLDKLLGTWAGVYPPALLADIQGRLAAAHAAAAPVAVQQPAPMGAFGGGGYGFAATAPVAPMVPDPRLVQQQQQQQQPGYGMAPQPFAQAPAYPQQPVQQQPPFGGYAAPMQPMQPAAFQPPPPQYAAAPAMQAQQVSVPDLLSSLMDAGLLAAPSAAQPAAAGPLGHSGSGALHSTPPYAPAAFQEREQPASTKFTPDRIKVHGRAAPVPHYLLRAHPNYAQFHCLPLHSVQPALHARLVWEVHARHPWHHARLPALPGTPGGLSRTAAAAAAGSRKALACAQRHEAVEH